MKLILEHKINDQIVPVYSVQATKTADNKFYIGEHELLKNINDKNPEDYDVVYVAGQNQYLLIPQGEGEIAGQAATEFVRAKKNGVSYRFVSKKLRLDENNAAQEEQRIEERDRLTQASASPVIDDDLGLSSDEDKDQDDKSRQSRQERIQKENLRREREAAARLKEAEAEGLNAENFGRPNPSKLPVVSNFKPNWYLTTAPAIALTAAGVAGAAHALETEIGYGIGSFLTNIEGSVLGGVLFVPMAAAGVAYGMTYLANLAQYRLTHGRNADGVDLAAIKQDSKNNAQQLGAAFLGAELARQVIERSIEAIAQECGKNGSTWFADCMGNFSTSISGFSSVEFKGALMVMTGLGLGIGLMSMIAYQDHRDGKPQDPSKLVAALMVGFAIGAAASIGYGNEIASYLMPLATTFGLLSLLPATHYVAGKTGDAAVWTGSAAASAVGTSALYVKSKWNQWNVTTPAHQLPAADQVPALIVPQDDNVDPLRSNTPII